MRVLRLFFALCVLVVLLILNKNISRFLIRSVKREQRWKARETLMYLRLWSALLIIFAYFVSLKKSMFWTNVNITNWFHLEKYESLTSPEKKCQQPITKKNNNQTNKKSRKKKKISFRKSSLDTIIRATTWKICSLWHRKEIYEILIFLDNIQIW